MSLSLTDPTEQTFVFPAAAAAVNESSSIYIAGLYEIVGLFWEAMQATTAKMLIESTEDAPNILDASCTWVPVWDIDGSRITITQVFTAAGDVSFGPSTFVYGPRRIRLVAFAADGTTAVNQDGQVVAPIFRMSRSVS